MIKKIISFGWLMYNKQVQTNKTIMPLLDKNDGILVQGITGKQGAFHTRLMLDYGTNLMCGVTPGRGGQQVCELPVFDTVQQAIEKFTDIHWSIIFVPAKFVKNAALEALDAGLHIVIITEHVPVFDTLEIIARAKKDNLYVVGPNGPGLTLVGVGKLGIMPTKIFTEGSLGVVSRSGTLTYEIVYLLSQAGLGQHTVIGCGGDPVPGLDLLEVVKLYMNDDQIKAIVIIGEIGGDAEELVAQYLAHNKKKPVVVYIAGKEAPAGKTMGHAGAIISGGRGGYKDKVQSFEMINVPVAKIPQDVALLLKAETLKMHPILYKER